MIQTATVLEIDVRSLGTISQSIYNFYWGGGGSGHGKLAKPSHQMALRKLRAVRCEDCPTKRRGSGHNMYPPSPLRKHGRGPKSHVKTAAQRPPRA